MCIHMYRNIFISVCCTSRTGKSLPLDIYSTVELISLGARKLKYVYVCIHARVCICMCIHMYRNIYICVLQILYDEGHTRRGHCRYSTVELTRGARKLRFICVYVRKVYAPFYLYVVLYVSMYVREFSKQIFTLHDRTQEYWMRDRNIAIIQMHTACKTSRWYLCSSEIFFSFMLHRLLLRAVHI